MMEPGTTVRLISDPGRRGVTTGKSRPLGGRIQWQVTFPDGKQYLTNKQLEIIVDEDEDGYDLFVNGKFGRLSDLRGSITHIRLSGRLADLIYSMETTNTDFYPYQFKPVLNFIDSPSGGILIADEVGLGKTIEAGLIWTELRSRYDTRRLMVVCPAMLREKWKDELLKRFGINASIVDTNGAYQALKNYQAGLLDGFSLICSMQGLRPNRGWDADESIAGKASVKFARFLSDSAHDEALIDLLIIDEAHYLRNPQSMTSHLGRLIRDVTDHVVLLSATPIHLKNEDLYHLLNLVDEDSFNQAHVFDDILLANASILKARDMILSGSDDLDAFLEHLLEARQHELLANNRQLKNILDNPPSKDDLRDRSFRSGLAYRLEGINLLGRAVSRTRKREVVEWRVTREPVAEKIPLTSVEEEFYKQVTELVRRYCEKKEAHEGFLLVTPQRQISSSMPAALREWKNRKYAYDQMYEDIGEDIEDAPEIGPLVRELMDNSETIGDLNELWKNDSKYLRLSSELKIYFKDHPKDKIIVFAYFRPTLFYLSERLGQEGIDSIVLVVGDSVDKYEVIERFKKTEGPNVLLASEVASEGLDLQFSHVLVNYDLPWNPMKVEQRIGRIDRLGQASPKITIWNLFYENTIDDRIYNRLYKRLDIFKSALGDLEAVLGEEIRRLTFDLLSGTLTAEQEEQRISQTEQAISNLRDEEERLEKDANNLIAHGDYILNQVRAAKELGRWVAGQDLLIYIKDFFEMHYQGTEFRQINQDDLVFDIKLSDDARFDMERFIKNQRLIGQTRITQSLNKPVRCLFKNQISQKIRSEHEIINQFHPLTRFVSDAVQTSISQSKIVHYPSVSLRLSHMEIPSIPPQDYIFYVERWTVKGVRDIERMVYIAMPTNPNASFLSEEASELLVNSAAKSGKDWLSASNEVNIPSIKPLLEQCMETVKRRYSDYIAIIENENNDRADLQEKTLIMHRDRQREKFQGVIAKHKEKGNLQMIAPTRGLMEKMETKVNGKLKLINEKRKLEYHSKDVCLGIIRVE